MESKDKFFIAVYTNQVKDYCDKEFFEALYKASKGQDVHVVDNTLGWDYFEKLTSLENFENFTVHHIDVDEEPKISQFQRNVCSSVNYLRDLFLRTNHQFFLIIESDVIVPENLLQLFTEADHYLNLRKLGTIVYERDGKVVNHELKRHGAIGGIYYDGFHDKYLTGLQETNHVLSGCTLYTSHLIEKYPFRYDENNLGAFPDALISYDAKQDFSLWNDHRIQCKHKHTKHGTRISRPL